MELYNNYVSGESSVDDVVTFFCSTKEGRKFFGSDRGYGAIVEASLLMARASRYGTDDPIGSYKKRSEDQKLSELQRAYAARVVDAISQGWLRNANGSLSFVIKKIELVARAAIDE